MAGEYKMLTHKECEECVKANKGMAAEKIAELKKLCAAKRSECLLAQETLNEIVANNPELETEMELED